MLILLRTILAMLLMFFVPGYLIVMAVFPRRGELDKDFDKLYRLALAVGLSIVIFILLGFFLNQFGENSDTGMGYFTTGNIILCLVGVSAFFFALGWWRGAYPKLGEYHPALIRNPPPDPRSLLGIRIRDKKKAFRYRRLADKKYAVIDLIDDYEEKERVHSGEQEKYYREKRLALQKELKNIEAEMYDIEESEGV